jgi:hypothetical protein
LEADKTHQACVLAMCMHMAASQTKGVDFYM